MWKLNYNPVTTGNLAMIMNHFPVIIFNLFSSVNLYETTAEENFVFNKWKEVNVKIQKKWQTWIYLTDPQATTTCKCAISLNFHSKHAEHYFILIQCNYYQ